MNLEHSGRRSYRAGQFRKASQVRDTMIERITYLEHERRGKRGEYKVT
jgi:hypothetical protein